MNHGGRPHLPKLDRLQNSASGTLNHPSSVVLLTKEDQLPIPQPTMDPAALPAAGASAVWKYNPESFRGYRLNDEQVGLWSDIASISVMG